MRVSHKNEPASVSTEVCIPGPVPASRTGPWGREKVNKKEDAASRACGEVEFAVDLTPPPLITPAQATAKTKNTRPRPTPAAGHLG